MTTMTYDEKLAAKIFGRMGGRSRSPRKTAAARKNGRRGGYPKHFSPRPPARAAAALGPRPRTSLRCSCTPGGGDDPGCRIHGR